MGARVPAAAAFVFGIDLLTGAAFGRPHHVQATLERRLETASPLAVPASSATREGLVLPVPPVARSGRRPRENGCGSREGTVRTSKADVGVGAALAGGRRRTGSRVRPRIRRCERGLTGVEQPASPPHAPLPAIRSHPAIPGGLRSTGRTGVRYQRGHADQPESLRRSGRLAVRSVEPHRCRQRRRLRAPGNGGPSRTSPAWVPPADELGGSGCRPARRGVLRGAVAVQRSSDTGDGRRGQRGRALVGSDYIPEPRVTGVSTRVRWSRSFGPFEGFVKVYSGCETTPSSSVWYLIIDDDELWESCGLMSESAKRGGEPPGGGPGEGTKAPRRLAHEAPAGLPALRSGMASWTTPDLSRLPRRPLDLPDVRSGGRRGPRAALRHRRGVAPPGQGLRRRLGAGAPSARCGRRRRPPAPSRAPSGPGPRSASAGEVVDDALENESTRVPGDA